MSNKNWGNATWLFFHVLAEKIKDQEYNNEKQTIVNIIKGICNNLPCPDCRQHASKYMTRLSIDHIPTKRDLKKLLFTFHNFVNDRLKKPNMSEEILKNYSDKNFHNVITIFIKIFSKPVYNSRLMTDNLNRNLFNKSIINYFHKNLQKYEN